MMEMQLRFVSKDQWCGDGICDVFDETEAWCPEDCSCGDNYCDLAESSTFSCPSDCVSTLAVEVQPSQTSLGGSLFAAQPVVAVSTREGEPTLKLTVVTAQLYSASPSLEPLNLAETREDALVGEVEVTTECGRAVFTDLVVNQMGSFTLLFTTDIGGQTLASRTASFTITRGTAHHIGMAVEPAGFRPAQPFRVQPVVVVEDVAGNLIDDGDDSTLVITASLNHELRDVRIQPSGNLVRTSLEGIVKYVDLQLPQEALGSSYSILFSSGERLLPAHSEFFVVAEVASYLVVNRHTLGGVAVQPFEIQPEVELKDSFGNLCTWFEGEGVVVVADLISPPNVLASMLGEKSRPAMNGKVFFTDLNIDKNGEGFSMVFRVSSGVSNPALVTQATSKPFNVTFGPAFKLALDPDYIPAGASPGDPLAVQPRVQVQDIVGNLVSDAQLPVTATLFQRGVAAREGAMKGSLIRPSCPQPTAGVCDCSVNLGCGIAAWPPTGDGLRLDEVGNNYTIVFSSPGLMSVESSPSIRVVFGAVNALEISQQPWGLRLGENIRGKPAVRILDKAGNFIPSDDTPVKVEMSVGGVCCYPPSVEVFSSDGIAQFDEIIINELPTAVTTNGGIVLPLEPDVRLRFSSIQAADYVESVLLLPAGEALALNITQQPDSAMPGIGLGLVPVVELQDTEYIRAGWYRDAPVQITATLCFNIPCVFGTYLDGVGTGQPCFRCTTDVDDVCSLHPETPPLLRPFQVPALGDVLSGTMEQVVHDGKATFGDIAIGPIGTYRFKFTAPGFDAIFSDPFTVFDGPIHHLAILTQPNSSVPLKAFSPQPLIELQDAGNNRATSDFSSIITASLLQLNGPASAQLLPENPTTMGTQVRVQAGLAWFQGLRISTAGAFAVAFASEQLPSVPQIVSEALHIPVGSAVRAAAAILPDGCLFGSGCAVVPQLQVQDEFGHVVPTWRGSLQVEVLSDTCEFGVGSGGWGQYSVEVNSNGLAEIAGFSVAMPQASTWRASCDGFFHLNMSGVGLQWALSEPFLATLDSQQLAVQVNAPLSLPGNPMRVQPQVQIRDADGRWNRQAQNEVSVQLLKCDPSSTNSGDCAPFTEYPLIGTKTARAVQGVVTFTDLRVDRANFCYRLAFSSMGLTGIQSAPLDVSVGAFVFFFDIEVEPQEAVAGSAFGIQPRVAAMDAGKNRIMGITFQIAATLQLAGERTTLLKGARSQVDNDGLVTFTDLRIDRAGECNRLVFEGIGSKTAYSLSFTVSPASPHQLVLARPPALPAPGWAFQQQPVISITDRWGNLLSADNCVRSCELLSSSVKVTLVPQESAYVWAQQGVLEGQTLRPVDARAVTTFTDLQVNEAGAYHLNFSSSSGLKHVSAELIVAAAADRASRLKVLVEPYGIRSFSTFKIQPVVAVVDMSGNVITSANTNITVSQAGGDVPGLIFYGTKTLPAIDGVVRFTDLQIGDEPAFSVVLLFAGGPSCTSSGGTCMQTSTRLFDVAGAMAMLSVEVSPSITVIAGSPFEVQPALKLLDASGRLFTWWDTYRHNITVTSIPNATLSCNSSLTESPNCVNSTLLPDPDQAGVLLGNNISEYWRGLASFTDLQIDRIPTAEYGGATRQLRFSVVAPSLEVFTLDHCCVTVVHAAPAVLVLSTPPQGPRPGLAFETAAVVSTFDSFGNIADTSPPMTITATLFVHGSQATLSEYPVVGDSENTTAAGVVVMSTLGYSRAGTGFTVVFSSIGLSSVATDEFALLTASVPYELVLVVEPQGFGLNDAFLVQPVVEARDRGNNVVDSSARVNVTLIGGESVGAQLLPMESTTVTLVSGVGSFAGLRISRSGKGMRLEFGYIGTQLKVKSTAFDVAQNGTELCITAQPGSNFSFGGELINPQPVVELLDPDGFRSSNHTPQLVTVALFQSEGPSPCPSDTPLRCALGGACVSVLDNCPALAGQLTAEFVYGVATFTDLRIDRCNVRGKNACFQVNYQFTFTASSAIFASVTSDTFVVNVGPASALQIVQQHVASFPGFTFPTQPEAWVLDVGGNLVDTYEELVSVNLEPASDCLLCSACPCTSSPAWFGDRIIRAVAGRAVFDGLGIDTAGGRYRLNYTAPGVSAAESDHFDLAVGPGMSLRVVSQDSETTGGGDFEVVVEAIDRGGNRVPTQGGFVSASVSRGAEGGGSLAGTTRLSFVFGLATFSALQLDKEGSCYILEFSHDSLTACESSPITVSIGPAEAVVMTTQPSGFISGKAFEVSPGIAIVDGGGNVVLSANDEMEVWLINNVGARSPLCSWLLLGGPSCVTAVQAVAGRATFHGLHVDTAGTGFTLRFGKNRGGFLEAQSEPFDIAIGPAVMLELIQPPAVATDERGQPGYPLAQQPWVAVRDAGGNLVSGGGESVNAELWLDGKEADTLEVALWEQPFRLYNPLLPTQGAIDRSLNREAFDGVSRFTNLQVDRVKQGFSIRFTSHGLAWAESAPFDIVLGRAYTVGVQRLPLGARSGDPFVFQPVVHMQDRGRNRILISPEFLMIAALEDGPGRLFPDVQALAPIVGGVAVFTDLSIVGQGVHTIKFSASALETDVTPIFNVSGDRFAIASTVQPVAVFAGSQLLTQPHVRITDDVSISVDADFSSDVKVDILPASNRRSAVLLGNTTVRCCWGQCLFTDLAVTKAGEAYVLSFTSSGLVGALSQAFEVLGPSRVAVSVQPEAGLTSQPLVTQPVVRVTDERGTLMVGCQEDACHMDSAAVITASIKGGTGGLPLANLQGNLTAIVVDGVANFTNLVIEGAGRGFVEFGYVLVFSHVELYLAEGEPFDLQYPPGPEVPIVYAKVLLFGIWREGFGVPQQQPFRRAIAKRATVEETETSEADVILLTTTDRRNEVAESSEAERRRKSNLSRPRLQVTRKLLADPEGLEVDFNVECSSDEDALAVKRALEVMLLLDGELARELAAEGLVIGGSLLLEGPTAFAADGSELFEPVVRDNTAGIVGATIGVLLVLCCGVGCYVGWWKARKRALIRSEDEDDLMWAIGVEYPKDDVDAALPWMAEKVLEKENRIVEEALSLRSVSSRAPSHPPPK